MRQSQHGKKPRGRGRKPHSPLSRVYDSNGPDVKIRGSASHIADKYLTLARDAHSAGDRIAAESYHQHAEHYLRIVAAAQAQMGVNAQQPSEQPAGDQQTGEAKPDQPDASGERSDAAQSQPQAQGEGRGRRGRGRRNGGARSTEQADGASDQDAPQQGRQPELNGEAGISPGGSDDVAAEASGNGSAQSEPAAPNPAPADEAVSDQGTSNQADSDAGETAAASPDPLNA